MSFDQNNVKSSIVLPSEFYRQQLSVDKDDNVRLRTTYDDEEIQKRNYELRKANPGGMNTTRTMKHKGGIPQYEFLYQPLLLEYLVYAQMGDQQGASNAMKKFLDEHPEYKASD